jgi:hypothetical protein
MKQTRLLTYLIEQLKENGVIKYNKDFLDYIGVETDAKHIKRLSDYMRRDGSIRDKVFLKAIEKKFGFDESIWKVCESSQIARIKEAIERTLILNSLPNKDALNISRIIRTQHAVTQEQQEVLNRFEKLDTQKDLEKEIDSLLGAGMLDKREENQAFLVSLLYLAYDKGLYSIIVEFILPHLYVPYRSLIEVQKIEAHTLGSLNKHAEAKHILHLLVHESTIENINLRTSALSNHKRELFASQNPIDKESLFLLIQGYQDLHAMEGIYSYYTGINLFYMVVLAKILFPDEKIFQVIDEKAIYENSKPSLKTDKTHNDYYVTMSELEFKLLLEHEGILEKIESFLEHDAPHPSLVERTLRQMKLFRSHISQSDHTLVTLYEKAIEILESYCHTY